MIYTGKVCLARTLNVWGEWFAWLSSAIVIIVAPEKRDAFDSREGPLLVEGGQGRVNTRGKGMPGQRNCQRPWWVTPAGCHSLLVQYRKCSLVYIYCRASQDKKWTQGPVLGKYLLRVLCDAQGFAPRLGLLQKWLDAAVGCKGFGGVILRQAVWS